MIPSLKTFFLICVLASVSQLRFTHSLSIRQSDDADAFQDSPTSTFSDGNDEKKAGQPHFPAVDEQSSEINTQKSERNPVSGIFPERTSSTDGTNKIETTTELGLNGTDNTDSNENLSGTRPVMEMVDVIFRPFRPPTILVLDFFAKSNNTSSESDEDNSGSTEMSSESNKGSSSRLSNNQSSIDGSNDDEDEDSFTITSTTVASPVTDSSGGDNNRRRRRETHQRSNNSKGDDNAASGESDTTSVSTSSKTPSSEETTGKSQLDDDMATTTTSSSSSSSDGNNVDDKTSDVDGGDDFDEADNGQHKNSSSKSGTVKIFLEILQLVPLSNSTDDGSTASNDDDGSQAPQGAAENGESGAKTVIHSLKANSNQKFSTANSTTTSAPIEVRKRVARSVPSTNNTTSTSKPTSTTTTTTTSTPKPNTTSSTTSSTSKPAEKGNPSSPATSASPSSGTTGRPRSGKSAPAALVPSTNAPEKVSSTTVEGPPAINITESSTDI